MFGHLTYIYWLILFIGLPLALLALWQPRALWRQRRALGLALLGAAVGGWAWDVLAVQLGAWYYDQANITNLWIGGLPLEEWLWIAGVTLLFGAVAVILMERHHIQARNVQRTSIPQGDRLHALGGWIALQQFTPSHFSHLAMLLVAGIIFHAVLWVRNASFLWSQRRIIGSTIAIGLLWMLVTDPIGGSWGAWYFDPNRVVGIWILTYMPIEDLFGIVVVSSAAACAVLVFGYGPRRWI